MADVFYVASRKGLFSYRRNGGEWETGAPAFLGEPVSTVLKDPRDGRALRCAQSRPLRLQTTSLGR